jgi:hypothetical protein
MIYTSKIDNTYSLDINTNWWGMVEVKEKLKGKKISGKNKKRLK